MLTLVLSVALAETLDQYLNRRYSCPSLDSCPAHYSQGSLYDVSETAPIILESIANLQIRDSSFAGLTVIGTQNLTMNNVQSSNTIEISGFDGVDLQGVDSTSNSDALRLIDVSNVSVNGSFTAIFTGSPSVFNGIHVTSCINCQFGGQIITSVGGDGGNGIYVETQCVNCTFTADIRVDTISFGILIDGSCTNCAFLGTTRTSFEGIGIQIRSCDNCSFSGVNSGGVIGSGGGVGIQITTCTDCMIGGQNTGGTYGVTVQLSCVNCDFTGNNLGANSGVYILTACTTCTFTGNSTSTVPNLNGGVTAYRCADCLISGTANVVKFIRPSSTLVLQNLISQTITITSGILDFLTISGVEAQSLSGTGGNITSVELINSRFETLLLSRNRIVTVTGQNLTVTTETDFSGNSIGIFPSLSLGGRVYLNDNRLSQIPALTAGLLDVRNNPLCGNSTSLLMFNSSEAMRPTVNGLYYNQPNCAPSGTTLVCTRCCELYILSETNCTQRYDQIVYYYNGVVIYGLFRDCIRPNLTLGNIVEPRLCLPSDSNALTVICQGVAVDANRVCVSPTRRQGCTCLPVGFPGGGDDDNSTDSCPSYHHPSSYPDSYPESSSKIKQFCATTFQAQRLCQVWNPNLSCDFEECHPPCHHRKHCLKCSRGFTFDCKGNLKC